MRAVKGRVVGNVVYLTDETADLQDQEVVVLIPTQPDEQVSAILMLAGAWSDMPESEWQALQQALSEGVSVSGRSMNRYLLDTDVISFYLRGQVSVVQRVMQYLQYHPQLELSVMSYYELRRGLVQIGATRRLQALETFVAQCRVWEVSAEVAREASLIAGSLTAAGNRLDDADVLIGATARTLGIGVATGNVRHFSRIPKLEVVNWIESP
jgi:tRNA(fMet)-specific endonuclease VapC